jgi:pimeloyl-ACP methyl ester carboxylesterase
MKLRILVVIFLIFAFQAMADGRDVAHVPLPADLTGTLNGTDYIIRVPANWNGTLLVFAHGAQLGPPVAEAAPIAWPLVTPSLEQQLLELGYALAGSGYRSDSIKEAVQRTLALTNFFKGMIGNPSRTIIWGTSLGGIISLKLIEDHPGIYDGAIANASPAAGNPENADMLLSFSLAYAAAFPWHDDLWGPVEDLRDDLDFWADVLPICVWPDQPGAFGGWEFIRLVMQLSPQAFYGTGDPQTASPYFGMLMWAATGSAERRSRGRKHRSPVHAHPGRKRLSDFVRCRC